ncbi:hypothetical protein I6A84_02025 [Frankia sp. CNm7]|uniref:Uncharacterized protein n=1 Tax=Frankia nepalensis TaxID=1836974 RepID=A0A937UPU8_9ACTN|nr:hypothetical protein [Frankia nepalensis]MBL7497327.1 hypothetical protein [Frankia nepalensis]MBL7509716.1 hypothetical protein [Frankia nepalensis]MBL7516936.1 hypothetical protein [Frankia nepalensis]MBL7629443.1 hypothetical protein [Frankia nepalensis]
MSSAPRTLLASLVAQRGWTVDQFCRAFTKTAAAIGADTYGITDRQAKRWLAGTLATQPYPVSRRVLEAMFDTDALALLGPPDTPPRRDPARTTPHGMAPLPSTGDDGHTPIAPDEEVSPTHRRDLLSAGVLLTATGAVISPMDRAAGISRAIAASAPDPLTLAQLEHGIHQLVTLYDVTPLGTLLDPIEQAWNRAETLLETCVSGAGRRDLERLSGWYAYYRGRLAHEKGDEGTALTFLVLAGQHAEAAGDTLLAGSVADVRAALAFFAGQFTAAAAIARHALPAAHPYVLPSLASQMARSLAQTGDADGALAALRTMRDNVWTGEQLPGPAPSDEEAYEAYCALALGYLGRGDAAERHAHRSLALLSRTGRHLQLAGSHLALARAFLRRPEPEPEQAAAALRDALTVARNNDHGRTANRAAALYRHLVTKSDWARLPAVRDLGDQLPAREALPPAATI